MAPSATGQPSGQRRGIWEPLPLIVYGYAIHPLSLSHRDTKISNRTRLSTVTENSIDNIANKDVVALEVGDEVYAFEKYTPRGKECDGVWYRGYVVCTTRQPPVNWSHSSDPSTSKPPKVEEPQQVFIGIFPASHIHVRDELSDAEGRLAELANSMNNTDTLSGTNGGNGGHDLYPQWSRDKTPSMGNLQEEYEDGGSWRGAKSFKLVPPPDQGTSARAGIPVYPPSTRSASPTESQMLKPLPPRPSLKSGDDTASGATQPIVDEIASALREWHMLMFQYLARRDYKLFHTVREHIEALHLGRRQLLAQSLSVEETVSLRRDCVGRLVSGNLAQGLDVIVRHPTWGALVSVDVEGEIDPQSWVSACRMYAMQMSLAYLDVPPPDSGKGGTKPPTLGPSIDYTSLGPIPTSSHSGFPDVPRGKGGHSRSYGSLGPPQPKSTAAKFYHVFLDLKAFVASLCSPGETAELFFSLYNKAESKFVTEEFDVVLNHNGVLSRDPTAHIRTLFTDLVQSDVQDPIFLVCRIVRNGALKLGSNLSSGFPTERRASDSSGKETATPGQVGWATPTSNTTYPGTGRTSVSNDSSMHFRRPFGCAVLELTQLSQMASDQLEVSATREFTMPIYVPVHETVFSMLHQDIIDNNVKEFEKSPRAEMMAVSIKIFRGDAQTIAKENSSLLQGAPLTLRLGFPDVVFPEDVRNELYIKLWGGDFTPSHSNSARLSVSNFARGQMGPVTNNVQVSVQVRDQDGKTVERAIYMGSGEPPVTYFHSMVFQRNNQPTFGELIKLKLPIQGIPHWHLFFTFRHRSSRERSLHRGGSDPSDRPFAFAFLPLFPDRSFPEDGSHTLILYRADRLSQVTPEIYLSATSCLPPHQKPDQVQVPAELQRLAPPMRDTVVIRSSLCSTTFTQNSVLLNLLHWEKIKDNDLLSTVLSKFTFVGEVEIVKFLRDIFDSLFAILVSQNNQSGEMDHLVFNALVTVLGIVQDRRFSNFQPVLDIYIEKHFNCAPASSHMIHSLNRLLADPTANATASSLRAALKVWHYIFKFIVRSRELQKIRETGMGGGATAEHLEATFRREVRSHLAEVNRLMSTTSPASIIGTQTIALQHFTSILPELSKIFSIVELVTVATTFANAVASSKGKIVIWKLIMYLQLVKGFLFDNPQSRSLLVESVVIWIKPYFGRFDEYAHIHASDSESARDAARVSWLESIRLCITVVAVMLDRLQRNLIDPSVIADRNALRQEQDNLEDLLSLLPRLLDSYREFQNPASLKAIERTRSPTTTTSNFPIAFPESYPFSLLAQLPPSIRRSHGSSSPPENHSLFNPGLGEAAIVFLALILSSSKKTVLNFIESMLEIEGKENTATLLSQLFKVAVSILDNDAFPSSWLNVNILAHKVLIKLMDPVATLMEREFIPPHGSGIQFEAKLWRGCMYMLLKLLSSEQLVIEEFSPQKRRAVWRLAGDIRGEGAAILLRLWDALGWPEQTSTEDVALPPYGTYQVALNILVGHVVNLCLSHHDQLRSNAVQILYNMIISEYHLSGHFDRIENEVVNKLDSLFMSDSKGDDISRAFFIGQLRHLFDSSNVDEQLRERIANFLNSVDLFLELLLSVRALPEGEEFADDRVIATLRLMNFIRRLGRDEMYIKYVHQLVNMHLQSQNYVEAALTLKLHSDLHEWDLTSFVEPMEELSLPQQSQFHRKETLCLLILDYLGKGKAWESAIEICKELAFQHEEVTFNYGRLAEILRHRASLLEHIVSDQRYYPDYFRVAFYGNFPAAIRHKQFIYRGYEWEKFGAFCERMLNKHPGAQLLKSMGDPPVDIRFGNDQYIQCTAVVPEPDRTLPIFTNPDVPIPVRSYYEHSAINLFSCSRSMVKLGRDGLEERWVEKTYFTTEESFPTVLRRSEVIGVEVHEISPVENALQEVEQKTKELGALFKKYSALAKTTHAVSTNALSMCLNGAVDAPIGSGVAAYRQVFLSNEYATRNPDRVEQIDKLRAAIEDQVRMIDISLKLHEQLCPPEMLPFHATLEKFYRKNFHEEIQRLAMDHASETLASLNSSASSYHELQAAQYQSFSPFDDVPLSRTMSSTSTTRPSLNLSLPQIATTSPTSPVSSKVRAGKSRTEGSTPAPVTKQTPLQRHMAQLTRHGIHGVSSGLENGGSDSISAGSPHDSFVNVIGGDPNVNSMFFGSGASITTTTTHLGSASLKGRFQRFGSLNFGRREG